MNWVRGYYSSHHVSQQMVGLLTERVKLNYIHCYNFQTILRKNLRALEMSKQPHWKDLSILLNDLKYKYQKIFNFPYSIIIFRVIFSCFHEQQSKEIDFLFFILQTKKFINHKSENNTNFDFKVYFNGSK